MREQELSAAMRRFVEVEPALLVVREIIPQDHAEKVLLAAVIRRAAYDLALYKGSRKSVTRSLYQQARDWVFSDKDLLNEDRLDSFMTFRNVCLMLNRDPDKLRRDILKLKKKDVRQYDMFDGHPAHRV